MVVIWTLEDKPAVKLLRSAAVWGPPIIAILTLVSTIWTLTIFQREIGRLEGRAHGMEMQLSNMVRENGILRLEIQTWQAHTVKLREALLKHGLEVPPLPERTNDEEE